MKPWEKAEYLHDLISDLNRIEYLEFCAEIGILGEDGQAMSEFVYKYKDDYEWIEEWIRNFRGEEE
tara:strand:+ start:324 stop:521 length:198 start_codon:yes stop_codon:yes gene_type:complete